MNIFIIIIPSIIVIASIIFTSLQEDEKIVRIGYFPNVNHAPAIVAIYNKSFAKALNEIGYKVEYVRFNSGTEAIQSLMGKNVDITYTGSVPAIIGHIKSEKMIKIIAGASSGGSLFIVRNDLEIDDAKDLANKKIVAPDYGNTQDVSLRSYLIENGLKTKAQGGNVDVLYAHGSETLILLSKNSIDGAWVAEPWATILLKNSNSKVFIDERELWNGSKFATTVIASRDDFITKEREAVERILQVHVDTIRWINEHKVDTAIIVERHIEDVTKKEIASDIIADSLTKLDFTYEPMLDSLSTFARKMYLIGIFNNEPDITDIYYQPLLESILEDDRNGQT
ncbi:MAG: ABC transporter substrate-binding protein [Candidatus Nitrosocaldaceae archaeon]